MMLADLNSFMQLGVSVLNIQGLHAVIEIVAKSSGVLVVALIASWLLRRRSASLRHRVWTCSLVGCVIVPLVVMSGIDVPVPVLEKPAEVARAETIAELEVDDESLVAMPSAKMTLDAGDKCEPAAKTDSKVTSSTQSPLAMTCTSTSVAAAPVEQPIDWASMLLAVWAIEFAVTLTPTIVAIVLQRRRLAAMKLIDQPDWTAAAAAISQKLGVASDIPILQSKGQSVPMTCGVFRSVVIVPADWPTWSDTHRNCVLSHELAHVKRRDVAIQVFARLVAAVYWFHPLVWWAVYRLRIEREFACDDAVVLSGRRASEYAQSLLTILRDYRGGRLGLGIAMADARRLDHRVEAVLDPQRKRRPLSRHAAMTLGAFAVGMTSLIGGLVLTTSAEAEAELSETISIHGTLAGPDGQAIADAEIYVNVNEYSTSKKLGKTNRDGTFRFEVTRESLTRRVGAGVSLGQRKASLLAVADGFGAAWDLLPSVEGGRYGDMKSDFEIRFRLVDDLPIEGRIVDQAGAPVSDAIVSVSNLFELEGGLYRKLLPALESVDLKSLEAGALKTKEINPNRWFSYQYPGAMSVIQAKTDRDGNYKLAGVGQNRAIRLRVSGPGIALSPSFAAISREDAAEFADQVRQKYPAKGRSEGVRLFGIHPTVKVQRARTVAGTVRDAVTGQPIGRAEVYVLRGTAERISRQARVRTNAKGEYRIVRTDDLAEVTIGVDADDSLYLPATQTIPNANAEGELSADFQLSHGVLIRGKVVEAGTDRPIVSAPRNFCEDQQPGPMLSGIAYYYPLAGNKWLTQLGRDLPSTPFEWPQQNHRRWVYIDQNGEFQLAVPPGKGVILIDARPPQADLTRAAISNVPYLTIGGEVTRQKFNWKQSSGKTFSGVVKPIAVDDLHAFQLIDPAASEASVDLRFSIQSPTSQAIRFVDPAGKPITTGHVAGLAPATSYADRHTLGVMKIEDTNVMAYSETKGSETNIIAIGKDGSLGVAQRITVSGGAPVTLQMKPTATLKFRLTDPNTGAPLVGYEFSLIYGNADEGTFSLKGTSSRVRPNKQGDVLFANIVPGTPFRLSVRSPKKRKMPDGTYQTALQIEVPKELQNQTLAPSETRNAGSIPAVEKTNQP